MIPMPLSVSELAVHLDEQVLSSLIESKATNPAASWAAVRSYGKKLLRAGGEEALLASDRLIVARNRSSGDRDSRIDLLQQAWNDLARRVTKNQSLNGWRHRKKKKALLVKVVISKAMRHALVALPGGAQSVIEGQAFSGPLASSL
jgi:hypothetical protein